MSISIMSVEETNLREDHFMKAKKHTFFDWMVRAHKKFNDDNKWLTHDLTSEDEQIERDRLNYLEEKRKFWKEEQLKAWNVLISKYPC